MKIRTILTTVFLVTTVYAASDKIGILYTGNSLGQESVVLSDKAVQDKKFVKIWDNVLEQLDDALLLTDKMKQAPEDTMWGDNKRSLRVDFNGILANIIVLLNDQEITRRKELLDSLHKQIREIQKEIAGYREKRITAPISHLIWPTKKKYDQKIREAELEIEQCHKQIADVYLQLVELFRGIGLNLDMGQVVALLSRVDSDDIIQMSAVFVELKMVTSQLMRLAATGGDITSVKRYYGMHTILIEMVIYMQEQYVEKINNEFLPKIKGIVDDSGRLYLNTERILATETDPKRKEIYKNNLEAQDLMIKVANLYVDNLRSQQQKVMESREKAMVELQLALNTFRTVEVCAELVNLMNSSEVFFKTIMNLQLPEIVPFENVEMQKKYQEMSKMILGTN